MTTIVYEPVATRFRDDKALITVRTGTSILFNNLITVAIQRNAVEGIALRNRIMHLLNDLSNQTDASKLIPNVPGIDLIDATVRGEWRDIAVVSCLVTNGSRQRRMIAEYRFVVVMAEEVGDALESICELERTLIPDTPPVIPVSKRAKVAR